MIGESATSVRPPLPRSRATLAIACAAACICFAACGKKQASAPSPGGSATTGASAASPKAAATPKGTPAAIASISRDTPERAAASLRKLAETSSDPAVFVAALDPSQAPLAGRFVGPMLIYLAHLGDLRRAAVEKFGPSGAQEAVNTAASFYQVELGNGLAEMFDAATFEDVRRAGPSAYVMSNGADGQPMGDAMCFREHQGEWLLLLTTGDAPWAEAKLSNLAGLLGGPMTKAPAIAKSLSDLAKRTRAGEFKSSADLVAAINALRAG